jgi:uncharacterized protein YrzB (UPF0473 family)
MEKIVLLDENGEESELYILSETMLGGRKYYLAADGCGENEKDYIFREASGDEENIMIEEVDDDTEFDAVSKIFEELMSGESDFT